MENMFNKFTRNHRIDFVSSMLDAGRRCCSKFKCSLDRDANSSSQRKYINAMKRCGILTKVFPRWAHIIQSTSWTVASVNLSRCSFDDLDAYIAHVSDVVGYLMAQCIQHCWARHKHISTLNYLEMFSTRRRFCECHMPHVHCTCNHVLVHSFAKPFSRSYSEDAIHRRMNLSCQSNFDGFIVINPALLFEQKT